MNNIPEEKLAYLDELIMKYHKRCPKAETPLNFIEWVGVEKMIEILEYAEKEKAYFDIKFDYSKPFQPKILDILYIKTKTKRGKAIPNVSPPEIVMA